MRDEQKSLFENQPVTTLYRVGPNVAQKLEKMGIFVLRDLLFNFPYRYQDRTQVVPLGSLSTGISVVAQGRIDSVQIQYGYRRSMVVKISDDTGSLTIRFFHFTNLQKEKLDQGIWMRCFGEVRRGYRSIEMVHPEYTVWQNQPPETSDDNLTPVYPLTEGIGQGYMRSIIRSALKTARGKIREWIPQYEASRLDLSTLDDALIHVHGPPVGELLGSFELHKDAGFQRLIFEELLSHQLARRWMKSRRQMNFAPAMQAGGDLSQRLAESLAFEPTGSQRTVIREIIANMKNSTPMLRMVQGDVGCGKTLVAAAASAWVVDSGYQVAIMAPTELLAEQHLTSFTQWFQPLGIKVALLTSRLPVASQRKARAEIRTDAAKIVVGTHALFQESVEFKSLGLIVIDEQHRFGVGQRHALREKGIDEQQVPHQLIMTATPIPRTLAMTFYADLDVSSIKELPPGRIAIKTSAMSDRRRDQVLDRAKQVCAAGQQVYWVCPLIDKSEILNIEAAVEKEEFMKTELPDLRIGLVHGRIKSSERDKIMEQFRNRQIDILVATTVIEVGVDVPNASLMVIENAERLGLAQLHQLRGRVGRGSDQGSCVLLYREPLSETAKKRLAVLLRTNDGFEIAETDMSLRGAGELLGTRQTGAQLFRIAELPRDMDLIEDINKTADVIMKDYPDHVQPLIQRWLPAEGTYSDV